MTESEERAEGTSGPDAPHQAPLLNIANVLTVVRILMVPVFLWIGLEDPASPAWRWVAVLWFALGMATDAADGHLARSRNLITDFGKIADPIADKAMTGSALVILSIIDYIPWWMTILILVREVGITVMRFTVLKYGVLPANRAGKAKTLLQTAAMVFCLAPIELYWGPARWIGWILMLAAVVLTVYSGVVTLVQGLRVRREALAVRGEEGT